MKDIIRNVINMIDKLYLRGKIDYFEKKDITEKLNKVLKEH